MSKLIAYEIYPNLETWMIDESLKEILPALTIKYSDIKELFLLNRSNTSNEGVLQTRILGSFLNRVDWKWLNLKYHVCVP